MESKMTKSPAEIAAEEYAKEHAPKGLMDPVRYYAFLAGAQWQKDKDEKEICRACDGNGSTNPPYWTVRCRDCRGSGVR